MYDCPEVAAEHIYRKRERYYNPNIGRFVSEDPIRYNAWYNFYAYAGNNGVHYEDPLGLEAAAIAGKLMLNFAIL